VIKGGDGAGRDGVSGGGGWGAREGGRRRRNPKSSEQPKETYQIVKRDLCRPDFCRGSQRDADKEQTTETHAAAKMSLSIL